MEKNKPIKIGIWDLMDSKKYDTSDGVTLLLFPIMLLVLPLLVAFYVVLSPLYLTRWLWNRFKCSIAEEVSKRLK